MANTQQSVMAWLMYATTSQYRAARKKNDKLFQLGAVVVRTGTAPKGNL